MKVVINIMLVGIILCLLVSVSGATWCDNDYVKRINVSVNNTGGSALTDYQVYVNLSTNPINETSLCVYNSTSCTLRPHWTENETSGNSYGVWINYSAIAASTWTNNTAIYYENAAASSTSEGTNTFLFFDDFEDGTFSTGGWDRYASNPIFTVNGTGWEEATVYIPRILKYLNGTPYQDANGNYSMYYGGIPSSGNGDQMGLANSSDLYNWTRYSGNPVLTLGASYDAGDAVMVTVLIDNGTWHTWYESNSVFSGADDVTISYANSTDGKSWTKNASNPILSQGPADDSADLYCPCVIKEGSTWKMWYQGHNGAGNYRVMYATASNPEGPWTKYSNNYIFDPGEYCAPSEVWKDGSTYYMTYYTTTGDKIRYATSSNGLNWTTQGDLLKPDPGEWDANVVYWPSQLQIGGSGTWYTLYSGHEGTLPQIGMATSDERIVPIVTKWENTYGTMNETGGYLDYLPKSGYFTSARSGYSPGATDSWVMETLASVTIDNANNHIRVGQVGTDNTGASTYQFTAGQNYGAIYMQTHTHNASGGADVNLSTVPYNSWYNTNRIIEVRKESGYGKVIIYNSNRNELGSAEESTYIPDITNPLGIYGSEYNGLHIRLYWFFVRKYTSSEPAVTLGSEEQQTTDTSFTVTLPSGHTYLKFEPSNSTAQNVTPNGQTDSQEFYNVTNTGDVNLDIRLKLNETVSSIELKADSDNNPLGAKEVNTTLVTIYSDLATTNSADIWLWSDFSHTVEQDTNKTINVNVTQST